LTYFKQITLTDALQNLSRLTPYGELMTCDPVRIAGAVFGTDTVDPNFWSTSTTGSGSVSQVNAEQILGTGITADSSARSASVVARFVASSQNRFLSAIRMGDNGTANNTRRWGVFNGTDGAYFKLSGSAFSVATMLNGVETEIDSSAWNGNQTIPVFTEINFFEIFYLLASVIFVVNGEMAHFVFASSSPWTATPHLPAYADNVNSGGSTTDVALYLRDMVITRLGRLETLPVYGHITNAATTVLKYGPGLLHRITLANATGTSLTVYDSTAGSGLVITSMKTPSQANPVTLEYGVVFSNGLTVVSTGTWDATVVYE
jgi:hypothetical protein